MCEVSYIFSCCQCRRGNQKTSELAFTSEESKITVWYLSLFLLCLFRLFCSGYSTFLNGEPNWCLSSFFSHSCLPYMLPRVLNLITGANTQLVAGDWKNRAYAKHNCLPQETFGCQKWNVWCICSSLSTACTSVLHAGRAWCSSFSSFAVLFSTVHLTPKQPLVNGMSLLNMSSSCKVIWAECCDSWTG